MSGVFTCCGIATSLALLAMTGVGRNDSGIEVDSCSISLQMLLLVLGVGWYTFGTLSIYTRKFMLTLVERAMHGPFVIDDADGCRDVLDTVQRLAKDLEVEAYVVGGPVRDQLLGIPYNDLDITVAGSALPLAERLATAVEVG